MPSFTDLSDYNVRDLQTAAGMALIKTNTEYLLTPNYAEYHHPGTGADYTVSGSLGVDIDSTNFSLSLTTYGGPVMAIFHGQFSATVSLRLGLIYEDSLSHVGRNLFYNFDSEITAPTTGDGRPRAWYTRFPGLPAGTYTFKAVWGVTSGSAVLYVNYRPYMTVWEA